MVKRPRKNGFIAEGIPRLVEIARAAGRAIMEHYQAGVGIDYKGDRSPVTIADRAAHGVIATALEEWTPQLLVVSEEGQIPDPAAQRGLEQFWLVDPLDGTKEFLQHNGEFTVNIALIEGGVPIAGVVHAPALDLCYAGARGAGAWRSQGNGSQVPIRSEPPAPGQPLVVVESRSHPSPELTAWLATVSVARRVPLGSSLKFCWVAEGKADVYPRLGPTMEWDVAAGDAVFRYSGRGGPRWSPLSYNKPGFRNGSFVLGLDQP